MRFAKFILKVTEALVTFVVVISLCIIALYAAYALWDNSLVYAEIDHIQAEMLKLKPEIEAGRPTFDELLAINPDVVGWVTVDNTRIDYPVLQGKTNLTYINTDIYGEFALAGSIFLDSRNNRNFTDSYSLLYGHSINNDRMFGDINLYKEEDFFAENQTGELLTPEKKYALQIFACLVVPANEEEIFNPIIWHRNLDELLGYVQRSALYVNAVTVAEIRAAKEEGQILALTTCSNEFTDARTAILAVMKQI